jgi:hypothetical protein
MSELLAKLKVKPVPKKIEEINVLIPVPIKQQEVVIRTDIIDKRDQNIIDRNDLLNKIRHNSKYQGVKEKYAPAPVPTIQELEREREREEFERKVEEEKEQGVEEEKEEVIEVPEQPKATEIIQKTKAKTRKNKTKLKLVVEEEEVRQPDREGEQEQKQDEEREEEMVIKVKKRRTAKPDKVIREGPFNDIVIGDTILSERLPVPKPKIILRASNYYMNNRKIFTNFISSLFMPYKRQFKNDKKTFSCEKKSSDEFDLLTHQSLVRDYINLYSPYRGLLLYHGLGSGKTCTSIAIAEGLKSDKQIYILTPASLRMNYIESLKKCGDPIYKKNQYWEFISTRDNPELANTLSQVLYLSVDYIRTKGGAWLINLKKTSNYEVLSTSDKELIDNQINEMIRYKYKFINYNGLRISHLQTLTSDFTKNPFDNSVVIVDEAHNLVNRIANKLKKQESMSMKLYNYLMEAENARVVLLTGTPIINYPNEIGILFNMLRGKIKKWTFKLNVSSDRKLSQETIKDLFESKLNTRRLLDYVEYKPTSTTLVVTRNPFGFVSSYKNRIFEGVSVNEKGQLSDEDFVKVVTTILKGENILIQPNGIKVEGYKALPDLLDDFQNYFIDIQTNSVKNIELLKRRILGLTSYFRSIEELMPRFNKQTDLRLLRIPMSDFQLSIYEEERIEERKQELRNSRKKKKLNNGVFEEGKSTYRIFSRLACNFVCPRPDIRCPKPRQFGIGVEGEGEEDEIDIDESDIDAVSVQERVENEEGPYEADDDRELRNKDRLKEEYERAINQTLIDLWNSRDRFLTPVALQTYSPKFLSILENILDETHVGLHLIYSQFRRLQGVGILKLILMANGFAEFKIRKNALNQWLLEIAPEDAGKPTFALYTGTESAEEKEIIRNIYNSNWTSVPSNIVEQLQSKSSNNHYGEIIKVLMITASGAEGIDLKNVRYVHLTEPYWHSVRLEQVIGRAKRICSHNDLPPDLQTVEVFLYLMTFTKEQLKDKISTELRLKDRSKIDKRPITSDETLYENATIKESINNQILRAIQESSIDCNVNSDNADLQCFSFGNPTANIFSYLPTMDEEEQDTALRINKKEVTWVAKKINIGGVEYAWNELTNELYDIDSYLRKNPVKVAELEVVIDQNGVKRYKLIAI